MGERDAPDPLATLGALRTLRREQIELRFAERIADLDRARERTEIARAALSSVRGERLPEVTSSSAAGLLRWVAFRDAHVERERQVVESFTRALADQRASEDAVAAARAALIAAGADELVVDRYRSRRRQERSLEAARRSEDD